MHHAHHTHAAALRRVKIIEGHLKHVRKMLEEDAYCIDILNQSQAVQKALKQMDLELLEQHLSTCTAEAIRAGKRDQAVREVIAVFKRKS